MDIKQKQLALAIGIQPQVHAGKNNEYKTIETSKN